MGIEVLLTPPALPHLAAGVLMTSLGIFLLVVNFDALANRVFALFLFLRTANALLYVAGFFTTDTAEGAFLIRLGLHAFMGATFAFGYFLVVFPKRRGWLGRSRAGPWLFLGGFAIAEALFLANQCSFTCGPGIREIGPPGAGPLVVLGPHPSANLLNLLVGLAGAVFLADHVRAAPGALRKSLLLVGSVFLLSGLFDGVRAFLALPSLAAAYAMLPTPDRHWLAAGGTIGMLTIVPAVIGLVLFVRRARGPEYTRSRPAVLGGAIVAVVTGLAAVGASLAGDTIANVAISGAWRVIVPAIVTYAILRHQLFDIDVKVRWTIKRGTVAAIFLAAFFIVVEIAQNYLSAELGLLAGGLTMGLLLFAIAPLQRAAERVANATLPERHGPGLSPEANRDAYKAAVEMAFRDGVFTRAEERTLAKLATGLGIGAEEALAIREAVEAEHGLAPVSPSRPLPDPPSGRQRP